MERAAERAGTSQVTRGLLDCACGAHQSVARLVSKVCSLVVVRLFVIVASFPFGALLVASLYFFMREAHCEVYQHRRLEKGSWPNVAPLKPRR